MMLEGGNIFFDTTDYAIYAMNSVNTGQYCVVLPKNNNANYNMLIDLHMKNAFDNVNNGSKTKEQLIEEIKNEYMGVKSKYNDGILVIPMIDENVYATSIINNDKQKMFDEVKKIGAITSEIYKKLTESGIEKQKIDQKITIIIKNNDDIKFVDWLKEQMPNFVIGINQSELQPSNNINPFMTGTNPFMPDTPVPPIENNNIFTTPVQEPKVATNDIFGTPLYNDTNQTQVVQPIPQEVSPLAVENVQPNVQSQQVVEPIVAQPTPVTPVQTTPVAETTPVAPNPVQPTPIEATTTIPVQSTVNTPDSEEDSSVPESKGSKGFTNLLILLVILAVVTIVSIELGKFLYNTYGV